MREYIRECILNGADISLESEHLDSVTFEDICVIIHYITKTEKQIVINSNEILNSEEYTTMMTSYSQVIGKSEERLVLLFIVNRYECPDYVNITYEPVENRYRQYVMSPKFIETAKKCGVYDHPITRHVIYSFDMKWKCSLEEADGYMNHYLSNSQKGRS